MKITQEQYDNLNEKLESSYETAMQKKLEMGEQEFKNSYALGLYTGVITSLTLLDIEMYTKTSDGCAQIEPSMVVN